MSDKGYSERTIKTVFFVTSDILVYGGETVLYIYIYVTAILKRNSFFPQNFHT